MSKKKTPLLASKETNLKLQNNNRKNFLSTIIESKFRKYTVLLALFIAIITIFIPVSKSKVSICVEYDKQLTSVAQLFYDTGSGYMEENSFKAEVSDKKAEFIVGEDTISKINRLRLDPVAEQQDDFAIKEICVKCNGKNILVYSSGALRKYVLSVSNAVINEKNLKLTNIQDDSNIYFSENLASNLKKAVEDKIKSADLVTKMFRAIIIFCSIVVVLLFAQYIFKRNNRIKEIFRSFAEKNRL